MIPTKSQRFKQTFSKNSSFLSEIFFSLLIFSVMLIILSNPSRFSKSTTDGLNLFISAVLPGLFPFMLLTKLLTEFNVIFKLSKKCDKLTYFLFGTKGVSLFAFLMSILSGYPIGAKIISDLYNKKLISENDAKKMSIFCTTSGPIFIIGAVGTTMFSSYKIGLIIYISHIVSSIILGIVYNLLTRKTTQSTIPQLQVQETSSYHHHSGDIISKCLSDTINSVFLVGAYITIFYLISEILDSFNIISSLTNSLYFITKNFNISLQNIKGLIYGLIEVTRGCKVLSSGYNTFSIALCCGVISFSGFSIIMQSMAFLKQAKIKMHSFIFSKLVHMILSIFICLMLVTIM